MNIQWRAQAFRYGLTWAFCLVVAAVQFAFRPAFGFFAPLVYSMLIGTFTAAFVSLALYLFRRETLAQNRAGGIAEEPPYEAWPDGIRGAATLFVPLILGYLVGSTLADRYFGWSTWSDAGSLKSSIIISVIAGSVAIYLFWARSRREALEAQLHIAQLQVSEAKLKLLESQLDPHLLFNTLANLRVLIGLDAARAQVMMDHMIAYLRATLSGSRTSSHSLQAEFERLSDYLELMQIRMGPRLSFSLELPEPLKEQPIPSLLLQPLVENAIKHGLEPSKAGGHILVKAALQDGGIAIDINDNGLGSDIDDALSNPLSGSGRTTTGPQHQSFGLQQVRERLQTVFGDKAGMSIHSRPGQGTQVRLTWPLR